MAATYIDLLHAENQMLKQKVKNVQQENEMLQDIIDKYKRSFGAQQAQAKQTQAQSTPDYGNLSIQTPRKATETEDRIPDSMPMSSRTFLADETQQSALSSDEDVSWTPSRNRSSQPAQSGRNSTWLAKRFKKQQGRSCGASGTQGWRTVFPTPANACRAGDAVDGARRRAVQEGDDRNGAALSKHGVEDALR
ncbi:hypothetical protein LTR56_010129 [Elasticomyces elasticus]|nr:hypothetical protein LTR56_010129 [Elasticomyces elasticus]KAK3658879.1 hypothetical protein LTR22_008704 [Elasticomyces elasticus]KAK4923021.1 hypothetical protein LTR49_009683 [Elasticomyces elasticus]KAK5758085.1 hypothetical protein LTS12_011845 [Elasticomyces elasticus]